MEKILTKACSDYVLSYFCFARGTNLGTKKRGLVPRFFMGQGMRDAPLIFFALWMGSQVDLDAIVDAEEKRLTDGT